jgi:hypothetical protein
MIGRGCGANLFAADDHVRLVVDKGSLSAVVTRVTFFGVHLETVDVVRGRRVVRQEFVPTSQMAKRIRVMAAVREARSA